MFKKVSAVALAAAMTLGSSVAAQAATVKIYFREWHQNSTSNSYLGTPDTSTFGREPVFTVNNVKKCTTYKAVLDEAVENSDDDYVLTWTGTDGDYLKTITIGNKPWFRTGWAYPAIFRLPDRDFPHRFQGHRCTPTRSHPRLLACTQMPHNWEMSH